MRKLTASPVVVGPFPPGVSIPSAGTLTLSILCPLSTLTCPDLSDLQLMALNRGGLQGRVAVVNTIGLDDLNL